MTLASIGITVAVIAVIGAIVYGAYQLSL